MDTTELVPVEEPPAAAPINLFGASSPAEVLTQASDTAAALADVIDKRKLFANIHGKKHVTVEGWTLLGSMLGVFPVTEWTRPIVDDQGRNLGWEARVEARTRAGEVVGAAEAECMRAESSWKSRDDYALRSMAQTRATSKAMRMPLGFVIELAGYAATPAEEMPVSVPAVAAKPRAQDRPPATGRTWQSAFALTVVRYVEDNGLEDVSADELRWALVAWATNGEKEKASECDDADRPAILDAYKRLVDGRLAIQTDQRGSVSLVEQAAA